MITNSINDLLLLLNSLNTFNLKVIDKSNMIGKGDWKGVSIKEIERKPYIGEYTTLLKEIQLLKNETPLDIYVFELTNKDISVKFNLLYDSEKDLYIPEPKDWDNSKKRYLVDKIEMFICKRLNDFSSSYLFLYDYFYCSK